MATIYLLSTENLSVEQTETLKGKIASGIVTTPDLEKALNPPTLSITAVCNDLVTESDRIATFTLDKDSYEPGDVATVTAAGAVVPGTVTDYTTTLTYPFSAWWDGETFDPNPSKTVTIGESGSIELTAVFNVNPVSSINDLTAAVANSSGNYYLQTADIDVGSMVWVSDISGTDNKMKFIGVYDGGDHVISNLRLPRCAYSGLFGLVYGPSTIANLTVNGLGFESTPTASDEWAGGILIGAANYNETAAPLTKRVLVSNVTTNGTIGKPSEHANHNTGGILGRSDGYRGTNDPYLIVYDCVNNASIYCSRGTPSENKQHTGGIVGYTITSVALVRCANHGTIVSSKVLNSHESEGVGGLIGCDNNTNCNSYVVDCVSDGIVSAPTGARFGSIGGWIQDMKFNGRNEVNGLYEMVTNQSFGFFAVQNGDVNHVLFERNYTLTKEVLINTPIVYKVMSANTADINLIAVGDYVYIDTSLFEPSVKFNGAAVIGVAVEGKPGVKKFTATAS